MDINEILNTMEEVGSAVLPASRPGPAMRPLQYMSEGIEWPYSNTYQRRYAAEPHFEMDESGQLWQWSAVLDESDYPLDIDRGDCYD